jgi:GT2 family glycosyltransferase
MTISIVVCTRNRPDDLRDCLASLASQRRLPDELLVVDASDDDASVRVVEEWRRTLPRLAAQVIRTAPGLTRQRNRGVAAAGGDLITFLDDDVVLAPGYLAAIVGVFQLDPGLGGAEGTVETPPLRGRRWWANAFRALFGMNSLGRRRGVKRSGFVTYDPSPRRTRPVSCLVGCNMTFRREVFDRFRFDEWYDGYGLGEDMDFSYRVSRAYRLVQTPHARLVHRVSPVARDALPRLHEMTAVNHFYFVRKNLPRGPVTWTCFAWSELGELLSVLKTGDRAAIAGTLRGYRRILREGVS